LGKLFKILYFLESQAKGRPPDEILLLRAQMIPHFEEMKNRAMANLKGYSSKSTMARAMGYFLENYEGLTLFLKNPQIPIDNNPQERILRNPVIGRKTWYGTHSERGAQTAAILFSIVETCKLNQVSPREYLKNLVQDIHQGKNICIVQYPCLLSNCYLVEPAHLKQAKIKTQPSI